MMELITTTHGIVTFHGFESCKIKTNGITMESTTGTFPGWHYGLIEYTCGNTTGQIISPLKCKDCGIYCHENQMIEGCGQYALPILVGVLIGLVVAMISGLIWVKWMDDLMAKAVNWCRHKHSIKRNNKKMARLTKLSRKLKDLDQLSSSDESVEEQNEETNEVIIVKEPDAKVVYKSTKTPYPVIMLLLLSLYAYSVESCDNTLFISSTGQICEFDRCFETKMHELTLTYGSTLCFRDVEGNDMKISVADAYDIFRANLVYRTGDYTINTLSHSVCKGSVYEECWNGSCNRKSKHSKLIETPGHNKVVGYGCDTDTLGCDTYCWHHTSCTYFKWVLTHNGTLYPMYKITHKLWQVDIKIKYKGKEQTHKFNINNPQVNLAHPDINNMPIIITGVTSQSNMYENHIIRIDDTFLNVDAAHINMPESDKLGDMQVSIKNDTITFNENSVHCQVNSCVATCTAPTARINRVLRNIDHYTKFESHYQNSKNKLVSKYRISPQVRLIIGNIDINNLKVSPAHCNINVISTFACTGCTLQSYAVLQADNIKTEGLMPFKSNCTFDRDTVSCNPDLYKLSVLDGSESCAIHIPALNKTLYVAFKYKYLGKLDPSSVMYSSSTDLNDVINFLGSDSVLSSIGLTWLGVSIFVTLATTMIRMLKSPAVVVPTSLACKKAASV